MEIHIKNDKEEIIIKGDDLTWLPIYQDLVDMAKSEMEIQ